jgi:hypothetical protein
MRCARPILVSSLLLSGCVPVAHDRGDETLALLRQRLGNEVAIQSMVVDGDVVCGYATSSPGAYPFLTPFMVQGRDLLLLRDDPQHFERAERACGAGWMAPNTNIRPVS